MKSQHDKTKQDNLLCFMDRQEKGLVFNLSPIETIRAFFFQCLLLLQLLSTICFKASGAYKAWSKSQSSLCSQFAFVIRPCNFSLQALLTLQGFQCRVSSSFLFCVVVSFHFISSSFSFCLRHSLLCVLSVHFIFSCCHISSLDEALEFSTNIVFFIWFHHCYFSLLFFSCSDLTMHSSLIPSYIIF